MTSGEGARRFLLARRVRRPLTFGGLLRVIRLVEAETQVAFAERLGVTKQHLSDIEHDRRGVSVERAAGWARALGYHVGQFVELAVQGHLRAAGLPFVVTVSGRRGGRAA
jgi:transcriptional regulator with XRE-family HTH domain